VHLASPSGKGRAPWPWDSTADQAIEGERWMTREQRRGRRDVSGMVQRQLRKFGTMGTRLTGLGEKDGGGATMSRPTQPEDLD
jgi:hypothetical protein